MLSKQEIEQAAKEWADNFDSNIPEFGRIKQDVALLSYREGCKMVNELQPYTAEDMKEFTYFCEEYDNNGKIYTGDELLKLWKESKNV
jgi:phage terminase small subunit